jgi:enterochelin esterase family protein
MKLTALPVRARLPLFLVALYGPLAAQQPQLKSHEVNPDHSVTFRYYAPTAKTVTIELDYNHTKIPSTKGTDGVWTLRTGPLAPELHFYAFQVDSIHVLDPLNSGVDPNVIYLTNEVSVPGATPQPWDVTDVPHGDVHHHVYRTGVITGLPNGEEDYYVYTPPGYDPAGPKRYPVLYLLHGWSSNAEAWPHDGQANLILDNLIAQGRAVPMIVVMPLGYGDFTFVTGGFSQVVAKGRLAANSERFGKALLTEIIPQVQASYRVSDHREDRAITGLSMGGDQSLTIGLNHPEAFGWVGGFSAAVIYDANDEVMAHIDPTHPPKLLWIGCGTSDDLIVANRKFVAWLSAKGFKPTAIETPGIHNWPVWRADLVAFAPLLFR